MEIRTLKAGDASEYQKLRLEELKLHPEAYASSYEEEAARTVEFFEKRLSELESVTLGAFVNGQLAGSVTLFPETKKKLKHRVNLVAMYVAPDFRKSGTGKALVQAALEKAKVIPGASHIYLAVTSTNIPAKKLYLSCGFETFGVDAQALNIDGNFYSEDLMVLKL
ncbi:hypothetical protein AM500_13945 [Bacillus sp. FJAT-18017]|uniref:GNAT family N-acetyltransferase n=1 Tax=Bacillus sp. FJAT-18017 TaxID=1705566 RepID=UPI0006B03758|nr:GNAT family N-acetyltransferase [Bacillus sp. FJAT-18017]ALC90766.1 hypothetical protein AM500_13945 [Bacillus sp. FJAT-18017]